MRIHGLLRSSISILHYISFEGSIIRTLDRFMENIHIRLETHVLLVINLIDKDLKLTVGEDGEWNTMNGIQTMTNESSYQVTDLGPYTVYSFRVVAVSAMGASQPSKESYYMVTLREGEFKIDMKMIFDHWILLFQLL
ncbi:hypothetical protein WA026_008838 [Henosepilachna vigintioctopunctata]|uniref:Fibronectin type-III domain-containing protein n=1 Tax=Henosepilachna vigintioctopunctata TaxID=420089 RepID=A0AAW1VAH7_9CUCU